jgi:hypothetical protein
MLVRRAHLHGPHAIWWIGLAAGIILLGTWPRLTDLIAPYLGVSYPPIVAVILGFALVLSQNDGHGPATIPSGAAHPPSGPTASLAGGPDAGAGNPDRS